MEISTQKIRLSGIGCVIAGILAVFFQSVDLAAPLLLIGLVILWFANNGDFDK
jgi:uncharacterized protein YjeT (DUF2065 family)